jgi:hypothetical protein
MAYINTAYKITRPVLNQTIDWPLFVYASSIYQIFNICQQECCEMHASRMFCVWKDRILMYLIEILNQARSSLS